MKVGTPPAPVALISIVLATGCATWQDREVATSELPKAPLAEDRVALEIRTLYVHADDDTFHAATWQALDEQHLPVDVQNRILENGFRCGLASSQMPRSVVQRLEASQDDIVTSLSEPASVSRFESIRGMAAGRRYEIVSPVIRDELVVLRKGSEGTTGRRFAEAQCLLALYAYPDGGGSVRIRVVPEVHYGPHRQRFTAREAVLQIKAKRDSEVFEDMAFETRLAEGQTLVLSSTSPGKGLGKQFFVEEFSGQSRQKLVLLRLVRAPDDESSLPPLTHG